MPVLDVRYSYRREDVAATLKRECPMIGYAKTIRMDKCSEFISRDVDDWVNQRGVVLKFSRPGKPTEIPVIEGLA